MTEKSSAAVNRGDQKFYVEVNPNPDFAQIEEKILDYWQGDSTFKNSVEIRENPHQEGSSIKGFIHSVLDKLGLDGEHEVEDNVSRGAERRVSPGPAEPRSIEKVSKLSQGASNKEFIFYDGPPFANGLPHYGHLLTSYVKDIFARYQTMLGKKVERRFGWDCHGMPAEIAAEKELGISGKQAIEKFGIEKFNAHCRTSVMKYAHEWEYYVNRQARWVDFENDYKTMDKSYMESVIWAFKSLYDKGLVYESYRVMPYSWAMETPVSNFETRMDNSYRERTDKAVTVAFELAEKPQGAPDAKKYFLLAWTTTPWTLPSNLALGINAKGTYYCHRKDEYCYMATADALNKAFGTEYGIENKTAENYPVIGKELIGLSYKPLFPYFADHKAHGAFKILAADFIEEGSGTGVVHLAPGFGEDDQRVAEENGIKLVCPVDERGHYTDEIFDLEEEGFIYPDDKKFDAEGAIPGVFSLKGLNVVYEGVEAGKTQFGVANERIIQYLKYKKALIGDPQNYSHPYPHCWRTETPLIYRALPSWYVEVTKFSKRMVELNQQINWIPENIKEGRFGKWLEGARDWSISRNRYWGCPIPIWKTETGKVKVFGSIKELEDFFGVKVPDLHRPFIDNLTKTEKGETWKRVTDVLDCWFESGSMPFAQVHYPFENKEWFESHFPADFIVEYEAQTRGWFYTLMVLGTALFDKPPFLNVICHGVVMDDNGHKLSKSKNNYVDPKEIFKTYGADAMRWLMCSSPIMHGAELYIDKEGKFIRDVVRLYIKPIWNAYNFFVLYANSDGVKARFDTASENLMDRYILVKAWDMKNQVKQSMDAFDTPKAYRAVEQFVESLNNWYIRRSKNRFWKTEKDGDKQSAYNTLYTALCILCRVSAPLLPLITEEIYRNLTGAESVHLTNFPEDSEWQKKVSARQELPLLGAMDKARDVCNAALSIRSAENIRVRQPLQSLTVAGPADELKKFPEILEIVKDEVNVKEVKFAEDISAFATYKLQINFPVLGKRLPEKMKQIIPAAKKGEWKKTAKGLEILGEVLVPEEYQLQLEPKDKKGAAPLGTQDALAILDLQVTPELEAEGIARDVVRLIQQSRKDANLNVSDHIELFIDAAGKTAEAIMKFKDYISEQTLAGSLKIGDASAQKFKFENELEAEKITIGFSVI